MATPLLPAFTVPAGQTRYVTLYMDGTDRLLLFFDITFAAAVAGTGCSVELTNGYGPRDAAIPYPYEQPIPLVGPDDGTIVTAASYATPVSYSLGTASGTSQTGEIWVNVAERKTGEYIRIKVSNGEAVDAEVSLSAQVT